MKSEAKKSPAGKLASLFIIALVIAGAAAITGVADLSQGNLMSKIFICFLGAVIVLQVVPCIMLVAAMCKGIYGLFSKTAKASVGGDKK